MQQGETARVVFMGSPKFAVPSLRALAADGGAGNPRWKVVGVVTQPDRRAGRGKELRPPPVKIAAQGLKIEVLQPASLRAPEATTQLHSWSPDVMVVAAFGQILRPDVLALPAMGCLNVHASLLPRWRGAAPIQAALLAGDSETGVTIMKMDQGVDTGGILAQRRIPVDPADTGGSLTDKLSRLGSDLLIETLPRYLSGELHPQPQDERLATKAPLLKKEHGQLDLTRPATELERRVRAMDPWPGAYIMWDGLVLKIHRAHMESAEAQPGKRILHRGEPALGTGDGVLVLDEVQPAGKRPMSGKSFLAGARNWVN